MKMSFLKYHIFSLVTLAMLSCDNDKDDTLIEEIKAKFKVVRLTDNQFEFENISAKKTAVGNHGLDTVIWNFGAGSSRTVTSEDKVIVEYVQDTIDFERKITLTVVTEGEVGVSETSQVVKIRGGQPPTMLTLLTGGAGKSKTWVWSKEEAAYGNGPGDGIEPSQAVDKSWYAMDANGWTTTNGDCAYDDEYTFSLAEDSTRTYILDDKGEYTWNYIYRFLHANGPDELFADGCGRSPALKTADDWRIEMRAGVDSKQYPFLIFPESGGNNATDDAVTIGIYEGTNVYQILSLTVDKMELRTRAAEPATPSGNNTISGSVNDEGDIIASGWIYSTYVTPEVQASQP